MLHMMVLDLGFDKLRIQFSEELVTFDLNGHEPLTFTLDQLASLSRILGDVFRPIFSRREEDRWRTQQMNSFAPRMGENNV